MASKFNIPVIPHAGGIGLCEYVQHLNLINKFIITNNDLSLSEYAESCSEHFENPAQIINGNYVTPTKPGYSAKIKNSSLDKFDFNNGREYFKGRIVIIEDEHSKDKLFVISLKDITDEEKKTLGLVDPEVEAA